MAETASLKVAEPTGKKGEKYDHLLAEVRKLDPVTTVVAHPCDKSSLGAVVDAAKEQIIEPVLVGPKDKLQAVADENGFDISGFELVDVSHSHAAAAEGVALVRQGRGEVLMKGSLHTDELMGAVVSKEKGLRSERRISHVFIMDVPSYPKPLAITDAAVNIFPDLEVKKHIIQNAIDLSRALGEKTPLVAILSAVETVTPKIPSTIEAAALCKMADRGQITGGILDGPLALDNAINLEAAKVKKIDSPVAGQADILVTPDLESGNMLAKNLTFLSGAYAAGIVLGARVPIVLTSRADSLQTKLASCAVGSLFAYALRQERPVSA